MLCFCQVNHTGPNTDDAKLLQYPLIMTCKISKNTQTSALEIILDVPPIGLFMKTEATKTKYRQINTSDSRVAENGHIQKELKEL